MAQTSFLTIICDRTMPPPESSNDAACIAVNDATEERYLCKSSQEHPFVPATEWICAELARALNIPVADNAVIQIKGTEELMFGSLWEDDCDEDTLLALPKVINSEIFTDSFAFDLSIHNADRHIGNFLYIRKSGKYSAKLIDASRAFLYHNDLLPDLPLEDNASTLILRRFWNDFHPYDINRATSTAQRISSLPSDWMRNTTKGIPSEWLNETEVGELDRWWRMERSQRIIDVMKEL